MQTGPVDTAIFLLQNLGTVLPDGKDQGTENKRARGQVATIGNDVFARAFLLPLRVEQVEFQEAGRAPCRRLNTPIQDLGLRIYRAKLIGHDLDKLPIIGHTLLLKGRDSRLHPLRFLGAIGKIDRNGATRGLIGLRTPTSAIEVNASASSSHTNCSNTQQGEHCPP